MKKLRFLTVPLLIFVLLISVIGTVHAQPPIPSSFYGEIHITDGAPDVGDTVEAFIPGVTAAVAFTTVKLDDEELVYNINIPGDIAETPGVKEGGVDGDEVTFKIDDRIVATGTWHGGTNEMLNFHPPEAIPGGPYSGVVGAAINFSCSATDWGTDIDKYEWDWDNDGTYDVTGQTPSHTWMHVGTYDVGLKVSDTQGGEGQITFPVTVGKGSAMVELGSLAQTFDANPKSATATTTPPGLSVDFTYDGSSSAPYDAGSYTVIGTVNDPDYSGSASGTLVIDKATSTTTVYGGGTFEYNGLAHPATVLVSGAGGLSLTPTPTYSCGSAPVNVAETPCTANYTYAGDANHDGSSGSAIITITKAAATIGLSDLSHVYDGTPKGATVTTTPASLDYIITYAGSPTPPTSVGDYTVLVTISDPNYSGSTSGTLHIANAAATVTLDDLDQTYDGTPKPVTVTTSPVGLSTSITYAGSAEAPVNAGSYAVLVTVTDPNYSGSAGDTLVIAKASSTTIVSGGGTFGYNGLAHPATVLVSGAGGLSLTPAPTYSCGSAPVNVAETPCTASYTYAGDANHDGSSGSAIITITKAAATVELSDLSHVYDGTPKGATVTTTPASLSTSITYAGSVEVPVNAGSYAVLVTVTDPNYSGSASDTLVIAKASSTTIVSGGGTFEYNGLAHPATVLVSGAGGLSLTPTPTYSCGSAPVNVAETPCTANYTYAGDANHDGSSGSAIITITKAAATIGLSDLSHVYDGTPKPVTVTTSPVGLSTSITYAGSVEAPVNAGSYAVLVTVTDPNYSGTASGTLVIDKAVATVTLGDLSHVYDGTPKSATATTNPPGKTVEFTYGSSPTAPTAPGSYAVVGTINDLNYSGSASDTMVIWAKHSIGLVPGWNLISFNLHPASSTAIADVLATVAGNYDLAYAWDSTGASSGSGNWLKYDPVLGYGNTLIDLDEKIGFWIHMTSADTLEVVGSQPVTTDISLNDNAGGWNLVGYPSTTNHDLPLALSEHGVGTAFSLVYAYDASDTSDPWKLYDRSGPVFANDLTQMIPGWGYWVKVSADNTWNVGY